MNSKKCFIMERGKYLSIVLVLSIIIFCGTSYGKVSAESSSSSLTRNVYYAYGMSADQLAGIDAREYRITHICYAFIYLTPDGKLSSNKYVTPSSSSNYYVDSTTVTKLKALASLKAKYPWLKIMVSIGGGDSQQTENFVTVASSQSLRDQLGISCDDLLDAYNLDGIDLDWEEPENVGEANNYQRVCRDIRQEIGAKGTGKFLTAAVPISSSFVKEIMVDQISSMDGYLDFWNLMTYDLGSSSKYSFIAPYERKSGSQTYGFTSVVEGIDMYYDKGVAYKDMNLGVPFYGKMLTGLSISSSSISFGESVSATVKKPNYSEIKNFVESGSWTYHWCDGAKSPYLTYSSGGKITKMVTYDDPKSLGYKISRAKALGIGGMMTWAYKGDDSSNSLKSKIAENINSSAFDTVMTNPNSYALYQDFNKTYMVGSEKSTGNGVWSTEVSSLGNHVTFKRSTGTGYLDSTSLKAVVTNGRYTIDMYCGFQGARASDVMSFKLYVPSGTITSLKNIKVNGAQILGNKTIVNDQWVTITTNAIGAVGGYVQLEFYSSVGAKSDRIYIDDFRIGLQK